MASRGLPCDPGGPCPWFCSLFRQFRVNALRMHRVQSMSLVFGCYVIYGAMTSCVMSWHHTFTGHVTFCYKRSASAPFWAFWLLASPSGSPLSPAYGWCLMYVGHDASSTSPGWSLLPSSIVIVLALVDSALSPMGT